MFVLDKNHLKIINIFVHFSFAKIFPTFGDERFKNFNFAKKYETKPVAQYKPAAQYYQRRPRKTQPSPYYKSSSRYQSQNKINVGTPIYAHKKRQQNPYYGRKKRNAE